MKKFKAMHLNTYQEKLVIGDVRYFDTLKQAYEYRDKYLPLASPYDIYIYRKSKNKWKYVMGM